MILSAKEALVISNALAIAIETFKKDAKYCESQGETRTTKQFESQIIETLEVWDAVEMFL